MIRTNSSRNVTVGTTNRSAVEVALRNADDPADERNRHVASLAESDHLIDLRVC
jgi:hypothetical protein